VSRDDGAVLWNRSEDNQRQKRTAVIQYQAKTRSPPGEEMDGRRGCGTGFQEGTTTGLREVQVEVENGRWLAIRWRVSCTTKV